MKKSLALFATVLAAVLNAATPSTSLVYKETANSAITGDLTFPSGKTLTLNGTLAGTPAGGTLNLSAVTLTPPSNIVTLTGTQTLTNKTLTSPTLTTPNIGAATGTSVNLSGAGTFGGNLTATGIGKFSGGGSVGLLVGARTTMINNNYAMHVDSGLASFGGVAGLGSIALGYNGTRANAQQVVYVGATDSTNPSFEVLNASAAQIFSVTTAGNATLAGNLTVSGTGTSTFGGTVRAGAGSGETLSAGSVDVTGDIGIKSTQGIVQGNARIVTFTSGNTSLAGNLTVSGSGGTTTSDVTLGTSGPSVKSSLSARAPRQGLVFNGTTGATVANVPAFGTSDYSFAVWYFYKATSVVSQDLFDSGPDGCLFTIASDGRVILYDRKAGATRAASSTTLTVGKSYFLAYSRTGQIYINGVADGAVVADGSNYTDAVAFVGKSYGNTEFCFGSISGALIYNRALSAAEVLALYESGAPAGADYPSKAAGVTINSSAWTNLTYSSLTSANGGTFTAVKSSSVGYVTSAPAAPAIKKGTKIRVSGVLTLNNGKTVKPEVYIDEAGATIQPINVASGASFSYELTAVTNSATNITFQTNGDADYTISSLVITSLGLLLAPDAQQVGGGSVWADTSGNAAHITLPGSGVSWNVPSQIGEYLSSTVASASAVSLSNGTPANVTSISLTAGDWDVSAKVGFKPNSSTTISYMLAAVSATSASTSEDARIVFPLNGATTSYNVEAAVPTVRISVTSTTTVYLVAASEFGVSTQAAFGTIRARRVR